jgi:hypothetical protein
MNQALILNDDLSFDNKLQAWRVSGMLSGQLIHFYISQDKLAPAIEINQTIKFDIEQMIEDWLDDNEIDETNVWV